MIRAMLVDDNSLFREQVKTFLAAGEEVMVVGETSSGEQALAQAVRLAPEVILLDVRLAGMSGLETATQLKKLLPQAGIIILSRDNLDAYRQAAWAIGAHAYVVKRNLTEDLLPAIRQVAMSRAVEPGADPTNSPPIHPQASLSEEKSDDR